MKLKAAWGPREESTSDCGARLGRFLAALATIDSNLASWYKKGRAKPREEDKVDTSHEGLTTLLERSRNRADVGTEVFSDLGFITEMWNAQSSSVSLAVQIGASSPQLTVANSVSLELPAPNANPALYGDSVATGMFRAFVIAWEPDWASLHTFEMTSAQRDHPGTPIVGWKTFLSAQRAVDGSIEGVSIEHWDSGTFMTIGMNPDDATIRSVLELRSALDRSGAMGPLLRPTG